MANSSGIAAPNHYRVCNRIPSSGLAFKVCQIGLGLDALERYQFMGCIARGHDCTTKSRPTQNKHMRQLLALDGNEHISDPDDTRVHQWVVVKTVSPQHCQHFTLASETAVRTLSVTAGGLLCPRLAAATTILAKSSNHHQPLLAASTGLVWPETIHHKRRGYSQSCCDRFHGSARHQWRGRTNTSIKQKAVHVRYTISLTLHVAPVM